MSDEEDVLKRPVHVALLRPAQINEVNKRVQGYKELKTDFKLPQEEKKKKPNLVTLKGSSTSIVKNLQQKTRLKVLHQSAKTTGEAPPCDTCVASCCRVFVVPLQKLEYESGLYGDAAVRIGPEEYQQLNTTVARVLTLLMDSDTDTEYYLEGKPGEPCPFLQDDYRCGIYEHRPLTCRTYSCVGDARITPEMRADVDKNNEVAILEARKKRIE